MKRSAIDANVQQDSKKHARDVYQRLDELLTKLTQEFFDDGHQFAFHVDDLTSAEGLHRMERAFRRSSVVCVVGFEKADSLQLARRAVGTAAAEMAEGRVDDDKRRAWIEDVRLFDNDERRARCPKHPRAGRDIPDDCGWCLKGPAWGVCTLGYLFPQRRAYVDALKALINGHEVPMMHQTMYRQILRWLEAHPVLADIILAFGADFDRHDQRPRMINPDSAKYVYNARAGTKKEFTKAHFDLYDTANLSGRRQMVVEMSERRESDGAARQLGYVPFSWRRDVRELINEACGVRPRLGFVSVDKDAALRDVFRKHAVSFYGMHLACWSQGVVHFEAMFKLRDDSGPKSSGALTHYCSDQLPREPLETIRMVCGTSTTFGSTLLRAQLAAYALGGFVPDCYAFRSYANTAISNMVFANKSTQYKKDRRVLEPERRAFEKVESLCDIDKVLLPRESERMFRMLGLSPDLANREDMVVRASK